jgi:hypothetical protein
MYQERLDSWPRNARRFIQRTARPKIAMAAPDIVAKIFFSEALCQEYCSHYQIEQRSDINRFTRYLQQFRAALSHRVERFRRFFVFAAARKTMAEVNGAFGANAAPTDTTDSMSTASSVSKALHPISLLLK